MNQREAARRQKVIRQTLLGLEEILTTNLLQELAPEEEIRLQDLLELGVHKMEVEL